MTANSSLKNHQITSGIAGGRVMDITYVTGQEKFNFRVCAITIFNNKILAMRDERSPYFYLPGGRVQMGKKVNKQNGGQKMVSLQD